MRIRKGRREFAAIALAALTLALATTGRLPAAPPDSSPTLAPATDVPESRTPVPTFPPYSTAAPSSTAAPATPAPATATPATAVPATAAPATAAPATAAPASVVTFPPYSTASPASAATPAPSTPAPAPPTPAPTPAPAPPTPSATAAPAATPTAVAKPASSPAVAGPTAKPRASAMPAPGASPGAAVSPARAPTPTPTPTPTPPPIIYVRGQVLSVGSGYLVFTTGQALHIASDLRLPDHTPLGIFVRATITTATRTVTAITFQPKTQVPDEIDASRIPSPYLASSVESMPSVPPIAQSGPLEKLVTVKINVNVPYNTPQFDDVYVATDRSDFGSAEVRMARVDLHRWTVQISLQSGTTLRYQFTRGFNTTVERDRLGGIVNPRAVTVTDGLSTDDTVARWADIQ